MARYGLWLFLLGLTLGGGAVLFSSNFMKHDTASSSPLANGLDEGPLEAASSKEKNTSSGQGDDLDGKRAYQNPQSVKLSAYANNEKPYVDIYKKCSPGVVHITTIRTAKFLRRGVFSSRVQERSQETGSGTGFIIDNEGHILTNYHVIENADPRMKGQRGVQKDIMVVFPEGSEYKAAVVGTDSSNDLALLRLHPFPENAEIFTPLVLGKSSDLQVGERVVAIGNPFGLERTMTAGIISSLGRSLKARDDTVIEDIIQTDAAINLGNSGGPLINAQAEVIGINTAILSDPGGHSRGNIGIGFAVPVDTIRTIIPDLMTYGRVMRAQWPGEGESLARAFKQFPLLQKVWKLPKATSGYLILSLPKTSSLWKSGIRGPKDENRYEITTKGLFQSRRQPIMLPHKVFILTHIEDTAVGSNHDIRQALKKRRSQDKINLKVLYCDSSSACKEKEYIWTPDPT